MAATKSKRDSQRKRNLGALHCAMLRMAGNAALEIESFKRDWLRERFGVEHSTELQDAQLWDALDLANGKAPLKLPAERDSGPAAGRPRRRASRGGRRDDPSTVQQHRKIMLLATQAWPASEVEYRLCRLITRQTRGRTERLAGLTLGEASGIICAFEGQGNRSGLRVV